MSNSNFCQISRMSVTLSARLDGKGSFCLSPFFFPSSSGAIQYPSSGSDAPAVMPESARDFASRSRGINFLVFCPFLSSYTAEQEVENETGTRYVPEPTLVRDAPGNTRRGVSSSSYARGRSTMCVAGVCPGRVGNGRRHTVSGKYGRHS